jgi:hypothetical protein
MAKMSWVLNLGRRRRLRMIRSETIRKTEMEAGFFFKSENQPVAKWGGVSITVILTS